MATISLDVLEAQLSAVVRRVEDGETIVVTRGEAPIFELVPRGRPGRFDLEAGLAYLRVNGLPDPFPYVAEDFDDPLPEDFLLRPLP